MAGGYFEPGSASRTKGIKKPSYNILWYSERTDNFCHNYEYNEGISGPGTRRVRVAALTWLWQLVIMNPELWGSYPKEEEARS